MQLKLLLVGAAFLSNFALLTYGRAVGLPRSDVSSTKLPDTASIHHVIEPRVLKGIKKKIDDQRKAAKEKKKKKEEDDDDNDPAAASAAGPSDDVPIIPAPAKYAGPIPNGMGQEPELSFWNKFLDRDIEHGRNPKETGGYLMYSGEAISSEMARSKFKKIAIDDPKIGELHDWQDTFQNTPAYNMWNPYLDTNPDTKSVVSFAVSFAQARRAAQSKSELHMLFGSADEPLMKDKSFWGAVEAGVITGPDSKVNKIWRYNNNDVKEGEPLPKPILAWDRDVHAPFGKKIDELDWRIDPKGKNQPNGVLKVAVPKSSPPQIGSLPFEQ